MPRRGSLAALQLAVFVGGGVVAPVAHLARHRPDHTHGPGGQVTTFEAEAPQDSHHEHSGARSSHSSSPRHERSGIHEARVHRHPHAHTRFHEHDGRHHPSEGPSRPESKATGRETAPTPLEFEAVPLEATHGHGSLAHLGLALLSAPPPLPLPTPRLAGVLEPAPWLQGVALFHPGFPRPRPPPVLASS